MSFKFFSETEIFLRLPLAEKKMRAIEYIQLVHAQLNDCTANQLPSRIENGEFLKQLRSFTDSQFKEEWLPFVHEGYHRVLEHKDDQGLCDEVHAMLSDTMNPSRAEFLQMHVRVTNSVFTWKTCAVSVCEPRVKTPLARNPHFTKPSASRL